MKRNKLIALLAATAMVISACGAEGNEGIDNSSQASEASNPVETEEVNPTEVPSTELTQIQIIESTGIESTDTENTDSENTSSEIQIQLFPEIYTDVLEDIRTVIDSMSDDEYMSDEHMRSGFTGVMEITGMLGRDAALETIGFCVKDINIDGTDELIIATEVDEALANSDSPAGRAGYSVIMIYTIDSSTNMPSLIADAWSRNSWFITADGRLVNEGSSGAAETYFGIYEFTPALTEIYSLATSYDMESELIIATENDNGNVTTLEDGFAAIEAAENQYLAEPMQINLTPISQVRIG